VAFVGKIHSPNGDGLSLTTQFFSFFFFVGWDGFPSPMMRSLPDADVRFIERCYVLPGIAKPLGMRILCFFLRDGKIYFFFFETGNFVPFPVGVDRFPPDPFPP